MCGSGLLASPSGATGMPPANGTFCCPKPTCDAAAVHNASAPTKIVKRKDGVFTRCLDDSRASRAQGGVDYRSSTLARRKQRAQRRRALSLLGDLCDNVLRLCDLRPLCPL